MKFPRKMLVNLFLKDCPDDFSKEGVAVLLDHIEQTEIDTGVQVDFDPINFAQYYNEMDYVTLFFDEIADGSDRRHTSNEERITAVQAAVRSHLEANGAFVGFTPNHGTVVYQYY